MSDTVTTHPGCFSDERSERPKNTYRARIRWLLAGITEAIRDELATDDAGRWHRIRALVEHAKDFQADVAESVADYEDARNDGFLNVHLGHELNPRRIGRPAPLRGIPQLAEMPDQAGMARGLQASIEAMGVNTNSNKKLDQLIQMRKLGLHEDNDWKEIYALVHSDVLRGLQAHGEGRVLDAPQGDPGDRPGEAAAQGAGTGGSPQGVG